ncbi:carbonate dehydratase [Bacillus aquiflavi]|uniref:carbonic anhydrase n=1 Tax=Bacillus aquiflavi TaxID=2672567 RepID=A0A6B3VXQ4_9BACI|nr:carbonic anhydrase [Bacillus aquiflavi]MBA4535956.1 carbonate dehydratase [Bacillus aquiflavi]NEY80331.1 carbonate dehydratase [Bacillus aquiflavi]UAC49804.1 carbonate dehydratase [Bacillus aquiflavi]
MNELELKEKNHLFVKQMKDKNPFFFDELKKGQAPDYFVLSCSDSRVSPSIVTQMPLGRMFTHRNIANQVDENDGSFSASLFYALKHLGVKTIIVKGHTDCGGVKAAWSNNNDEELKPWLKNITKSLPEKGSGDYSIDTLTKLNVIKQVERIKKHPIYQQYGEGVDVVGCLFHVENGELECVTSSFEK